MTTEDVLSKLVKLEEAPWADLRGKPLNARGLAVRLRPYGVEPKVIRIGPAGMLALTFMMCGCGTCLCLPLEAQQAQQPQHEARQNGTIVHP